MKEDNFKFKINIDHLRPKGPNNSANLQPPPMPPFNLIDNSSVRPGGPPNMHGPGPMPPNSMFGNNSYQPNT